MDPYDGVVLGPRFDPRWDPIRRSLGDTLRYAERIDLAAAAPRGELASTGYCLANPEGEYLVFLPAGGAVTVDLSASPAAHIVEWFDLDTGKSTDAGTVLGGARRELTVSFAGEAVLFLRSRRREASDGAAGA
jgi:hypothetical protein